MSTVFYLAFGVIFGVIFGVLLIISREVFIEMRYKRYLAEKEEKRKAEEKVYEEYNTKFNDFNKWVYCDDLKYEELVKDKNFLRGYVWKVDDKVAAYIRLHEYGISNWDHDTEDEDKLIKALEINGCKFEEDENGKLNLTNNKTVDHLVITPHIISGGDGIVYRDIMPE